MRFLTVQLNRTLIKKNNRHDGLIHKNAQNIFKANFRIEWVKSPLQSEYNLFKHVSVQNALYEKLSSLDPLYDKNLIILYNIFRRIKKSFNSM